MCLGTKRPSIGHYASCASVVVLALTGVRHLLFTSSILAANLSLRIFNITKMAAKRLQRAMHNVQ